MSSVASRAQDRGRVRLARPVDLGFDRHGAVDDMVVGQTVPEAVRIMPVPSSPPPEPVAVMSTVAGSTRAAIEETFKFDPGGP